MSQTVREITEKILKDSRACPFDYFEALAAHVLASTESLGDERFREIEARWTTPSPLGLAWPEMNRHGFADFPVVLAEIRRLQAELKARSAALERSERERAICYGNEGALIAEIADLRAQLQAAQQERELHISQRNAAIKAEKRDAEKALLALSKAGFPTPTEGYGFNSSWAISDLCRWVNRLEIEDSHVAWLRFKHRGDNYQPNLVICDSDAPAR